MTANNTYKAELSHLALYRTFLLVALLVIYSIFVITITFAIEKDIFNFDIFLLRLITMGLVFFIYYISVKTISLRENQIKTQQNQDNKP